MGVFNIDCVIENQQESSRSVRIPKLLVDIGNELSWINYKYLDKISVEPEKKICGLLLQTDRK